MVSQCPEHKYVLAQKPWKEIDVLDQSPKMEVGVLFKSPEKEVDPESES